MEIQDISGRRHKDDGRRAKVIGNDVRKIDKKAMSQGSQFIREANTGVLLPPGERRVRARNHVGVRLDADRCL